MMYRILIAILFVYFLSSCSCLRRVVGRVVDQNTHLPIVAAQVSITNKGHYHQFETDSVGFFEAYLSGGRKCPRIKALVKAQGYIAQEIREPKNRDTLTIYLQLDSTDRFVD